ncbi:MAG: ABC transporter permease subunit [Methanobacteriota archaeon]
MSLGKRIARATRFSPELRLALVLALPMFWLLFFLVVPLGFVGVYGLSYYDDAYSLQIWPFDLSNYLDAISIGAGATVLPLLFRTFGMAALTSVISLVVGYAMAYYIARIAKERWRGVLMGLVVIPFWVSFIVRIYAVFPFTSDFPESFFHTGLRGVGLGFVSDWVGGFFTLNTGQMVVFTLMYVWLPFMILPLFASLSKLDPILLEAAYDLGASRWRAFLHVTLPLTYPAMIVGSVLIFITTVGSFIELTLVGGRAWQFIGNYITDQFNLIGGLPLASGSALFIIIVTVLLISVYRKYAELEEEGETEVRSRILGPLWRYVRSMFRRERGAEPAPVATTMPDGGVATGPGARLLGGPIHRAGWEKALDVVSEKAGRYILGFVTLVMLLFFFVPLIIVAIFSFNGGIDTVILQGFSLDWWIGGNPTRDGLFEDEASLGAIFYSFVIAGASSLIAVFVGLLAAFAITRYRFRARGVLRSLMYLGLVVPSIVLGISLAILIRFVNYYVLGPLSLGFNAPTPLQWEFGLASIVIGHTTFNIPLATLVLIISFREFDRTLEEAAMNLGADELTTFFRVTLPNIMPGIISAILLGFTFSFDEVPVTLFLVGGNVQTLPVLIWGLISKKILSPRVNAAATIVLVLSFVFVFVMTKLGKRGGQLFRI